MAEPEPVEGENMGEAPVNDLAAQWNADRQKEREDAQQSALDVLLSMPFRPGRHDEGEQAKGDMEWLLAEWDRLLRVGEGLLQTRMVRKGLNSAAEVALVLALGRELRIKPVQAINNIYVVNNKPALESKLMAGLVFREHGPEAIHYVELTRERAVIDFRRKGQAEATRFVFTTEDAQTAGLLDKAGNVWQQYTQFMLRHRCISMGCNAIFPDVTLGLITPEELGIPSKVEDDGQVVVDRDALARHQRRTDEANDPLLADVTLGLGVMGGMWRETVQQDEIKSGSGTGTRNVFRVTGYPDDYLFVTYSKIERYKRDTEKNAGPGRPFTAEIVKRNRRGGKVYFKCEHLRHPLASGALEVKDFDWEAPPQQEDANDVAASAHTGAGGGAQHATEDSTPSAPPPPAPAGKDADLATLTIPELHARCKAIEKRLEPGAWLDACKQHFGLDPKDPAIVKLPDGCGSPVRLATFIEECEATLEPQRGGGEDERRSAQGDGEPTQEGAETGQDGAAGEEGLDVDGDIRF